MVHWRPLVHWLPVVHYNTKCNIIMYYIRKNICIYIYILVHWWPLVHEWSMVHWGIGVLVTIGALLDMQEELARSTPRSWKTNKNNKTNKTQQKSNKNIPWVACLGVAQVPEPTPMATTPCAYVAFSSCFPQENKEPLGTQSDCLLLFYCVLSVLLFLLVFRDLGVLRSALLLLRKQEEEAT